VKRVLKRLIEASLRPFGYELAKLPADPFALQARLVGGADPVIFDVGAYTGEVAAIYRHHFPGATIHCFEPFPETFGTLVGNVGGDPRISCHQVAVSDAAGRALLHSNRFAPTNSLLATDERGSAFWGEGLLDSTSTVEVATTTLDAFCQEKDIPRVDILKMDVQGAEFLALEGARGLLKEGRISIIYTELITCPTYRGQHRFGEYIALLDCLGSEVLDFYNPVRRWGRLMQADLIFVGPAVKASLERMVGR